jgi:dipeptidyl aminopeptidase/acylaminoacyl peptidase
MLMLSSTNKPGYLCFSVFICGCLFAQAPSIDQSLSLKSASNPKISPDGKYVAYQVSETNWEENAFKTEIWGVEVASGSRFQYTNTKKSSSQPEWSPDGKQLAFLSDRDGRQQLYVIATAGGEAMQLTKGETAVRAFRWSPDGRRIAYTIPEIESKAMKNRKERYGDYQVVRGDYTFAHLWMVEVRPQENKLPEAQRITGGGEWTVGGFSWSPDGKQIAFNASRDPDLSSRHTEDIYVVTLEGKAVKRIVSTPGPDTNPVWSPDGREIAYQTSNGAEFFYYSNTLLAAVPAEGGAPRLLSKSFDENPGLLAWAADGIYFTAAQRTYAHLFRVHPGTLAIERVSGPAKRVYGGFSFTADHRHTAFTGDGAGDGQGQYAEVYVSPVAGFAPRQLTAMGDQLKEFRLATREVIEWKSTDGTPIEGVLIKPADFDPAKKYPLLVVIHGGPTGVDRPVPAADRYYPLEMFAAKGALILRPNYRGSAGYGEKFRSLNVRNLGVGDYWDVISGVDHLIAKGWADRDRVGSMGWSQGGYISAFITCFSDRFKAVSVGAGISNWMTYYVNTDIDPFTRQYLKATPWDDPEIYRKTSPMTYIKGARTPTLIQHGENDRRVPIPNAFELQQGLEDRGVPVRMVVYKGFGHGIDKPKQQRSVMEENWKWFGRWIWGEKE